MDCTTIFHEMAPRFDGQAAGDWNAVIQFNVSGERGGDFTVAIADGSCVVTDGNTDDPGSRVTVSDETWLGIVDGSVNPMTAFMTGKIKIKGNMGDVLKLQDPSLFKRD